MKQKELLNEQIIYQCKPHGISILWPAIVGFCLFAGSVGSSENKIAGLAGGLILAALVLFIPIIRVKSNSLVLTDKRLYGKTGIFKTTSLTTPIAKIQTINIEQGLIGKIFGYSDLTIHCVTGVYIFKKQSNAIEMQNAILNVMK